MLGATSCTRDLHPLERAHAERTKTQSWLTRQLSGKNITWRKTMRKNPGGNVNVRLYKGFRLADDAAPSTDLF